MPQQQNQPQKKGLKLKNKITRYSKLILIVSGILLATIALVVGGTLAGWDILGWLRSPMAILMYFLIVLAGVVYAFRKLYKRGS